MRILKKIGAAVLAFTLSMTICGSAAKAVAFAQEVNVESKADESAQNAKSEGENLLPEGSEFVSTLLLDNEESTEKHKIFVKYVSRDGDIELTSERIIYEQTGEEQTETTEGYVEIDTSKMKPIRVFADAEMLAENGYKMDGNDAVILTWISLDDQISYQSFGFGNYTFENTEDDDLIITFRIIREDEEETSFEDIDWSQYNLGGFESFEEFFSYFSTSSTVKINYVEKGTDKVIASKTNKFMLMFPSTIMTDDEQLAARGYKLTEDEPEYYLMGKNILPSMFEGDILIYSNDFSGMPTALKGNEFNIYVEKNIGNSVIEVKYIDELGNQIGRIEEVEVPSSNETIVLDKYTLSSIPTGYRLKNSTQQIEIAYVLKDGQWSLSQSEVSVMVETSEMDKVQTHSGVLSSTTSTTYTPKVLGKTFTAPITGDTAKAGTVIALLAGAGLLVGYAFKKRR